MSPLRNFCVSRFFRSFLIFVASGQEKNAALISIIRFFIGHLENANYLPDKNCVSLSNHKNIEKLAYLGVKMTSLDKTQNRHESCKYRCIKIAYLVERHKIVRKVAYPRVRKLCKYSVSQERKCCILICVNQKIALVKNDVISLY